MPRQVSLLSCWDVFVCKLCLGHKCSVEEKLEVKRDEDVLEEVEKFCYLDEISCYSGASETVNIAGSALKKFSKLSGVFIFEAGFISEATGEDLSVLC